MSDRMVSLEFYNPDATLAITRLVVSRDSIGPILAWYGAYFAGDEYAVMIDGEEIKIDGNGERESLIIEATPDPAGGMPVEVK